MSRPARGVRIETPGDTFFTSARMVAPRSGRADRNDPVQRALRQFLSVAPRSGRADRNAPLELEDYDGGKERVKNKKKLATFT